MPSAAPSFGEGRGAGSTRGRENALEEGRGGEALRVEKCGRFTHTYTHKRHLRQYPQTDIHTHS